MRGIFDWVYEIVDYWCETPMAMSVIEAGAAFSSADQHQRSAFNILTKLSQISSFMLELSGAAAPAHCALT